ncbi:ABC transporter permease, partial [Pseudomonas sp. BGM005]|nr:ABC transporter permease [Pseudomonas sp. BG5]
MSGNIETKIEAKETGFWDKLIRISMKEAGVAIALVLIVIFFSATAPYFATPEN